MDIACWPPGTESRAAGLADVKSDMVPLVRMPRRRAFRPGARRPMFGAFSREVGRERCAFVRRNVLSLLKFRAPLPSNDNLLYFAVSKRRGLSLRFCLSSIFRATQQIASLNISQSTQRIVAIFRNSAQETARWEDLLGSVGKSFSISPVRSPSCGPGDASVYV